MQTMRITPVPGPRAQSTRRHEPVARGYHPTPAPMPLRVAWAVLRGLRALRMAGRRRLYGEPELVVAFLAGLVLAACTFFPFLPR